MGSSRNLRTALSQANVDQAKGTFDGLHSGLHHRRERSLIATDKLSGPTPKIAYHMVRGALM